MSTPSAATSDTFLTLNLVSRIRAQPAIKTIRQSHVRWARCEALVRQLEALVQAHASLDASVSMSAPQHQMALKTAARLERDAGELAGVVRWESNRVTVEMLTAELAEKKRKARG